MEIFSLVRNASAFEQAQMTQEVLGEHWSTVFVLHLQESL